MRTAPTVHHFGPDPAYVGGIGSVIRLLTMQRVGAESVRFHPTWRPDATFASLPLALRSGMSILRMRKSAVVHVHLAEDGSFVREGAIVVLSRLAGQPTVVTIHGAHFLAFARRHRRLAAFVLARAHLITCLDRDAHALVSQLARRSRVELLPNPVVIDVESPAVDETDEVVLFAGEIGLRKGADVLCRAWPLISQARPRARCVMVGPVNDFSVPEMERLDSRPPVDAIGMKSMLRSARVVVLPSRAEAMPMVLTEAMGAGRPFVGTPVGGVPDLARRGGVLVAVDDHAELASSVIELLADPARAARIGEQGRRFCAETRSTAVIGSRLGELYADAAMRALS
jgi:glycosyltransferase involved in cell wall biosynthesis